MLLLLEKSSKPTKGPKNNGGSKNPIGENIVKMSLSKSDVNGVFQFSKISTVDNAKRPNKEVRAPAKTDEVEPAEKEGGEQPGRGLSSEGILTIIILLSAAALGFLLCLAISRHLPPHLTNCSYFPQDLTDKTEESEDQNNCEDEFVYISPLTSV